MEVKEEINIQQSGDRISSELNLCRSIRKATNKVNLQLNASENV